MTQAATALIETRALAEAIVFRVPRKLWKSRNHEREFIVDRRLLGPVKVVKRFDLVVVSARRRRLI